MFAAYNKRIGQRLLYFIAIMMVALVVIRFTKSNTAVALACNGSTININFQTSGASGPTCYLVDGGHAFGDRGNGQSYGWLSDNQAGSRDRNHPQAPDERYDTFNHMQLAGSDTHWELAVDNGWYWVHVVAGDAEFANGFYAIEVEGTLTVSGTPNKGQHWLANGQMVEVTDGRLTISNHVTATSNKLSFIEVTPLPAAPGPFAAKVNFQPVGSSAPTGYVADEGAVYGANGGGFLYGWDRENGDGLRDRNWPTSLDERFDTVAHMQTYGAYRWEMGVPNGTYALFVMAGDPRYFLDHQYQFDVEGHLLADDQGLTSNRLRAVGVSGIVTVTDGRLTIDNGGNGQRNKLHFVHIQQIGAAEEGGQIQVTVPQSTFSVGDTVSVTVAATGIETAITAYQFDLTYNGDVLALTAVDSGDFLQTATQAVSCPPWTEPTVGTVRLACVGAGPDVGVSGNGRLATLTFVALADGRSGLTVSGLQLPDTAVPPQATTATIASAQVTVLEEEEMAVVVGNGRYQKKAGSGGSFILSWLPQFDGVMDNDLITFSMLTLLLTLTLYLTKRQQLRHFWRALTVVALLLQLMPLVPATYAASHEVDARMEVEALRRTPERVHQARAPETRPLNCYNADLDCDSDVDEGDVTQASYSWDCVDGLTCFIANVDMDDNSVIDAFDLAWIANDYDIMPPLLTIESPLADEIIQGATATVTGMVTDTHTVATVTVNDIVATLNGTQFTADVPLSDGNQVLHVAAYDEVGQVGLADQLVQVDAEGPLVTIQIPSHRQAVYSVRPTVAIRYTDFYTTVAVGSLQALLQDEIGGTIDVTADLLATPTGAQGALQTPLTPDSSYTLTVSVADAFGNRSTAIASFYVASPSITPPEPTVESGWVSGVVYNSATCDPHLTVCQGLAGAHITLVAVDETALDAAREARQQQLATQSWHQGASLAATVAFTTAVTGTIVTGPDGFFAFPAETTGRYWLRVEKEGYTYGQRQIEIVRDRSTAVNGIYLTPLDTAVTPCDDRGCSHTNSDGSIQLEIPPGAIPAGQSHDIQATRFDSVEFLPSGELPPNTWETYAFNLGGDSEITFTRPITVQVANTIGFAPGTPIPLGYWNQTTQLWEHAGTGIVDVTGQWVEMQVTHFSNYDCNDPIAPPSETEPDADDESDDDKDKCGEGEGGCFINLKTGEFEEDVSLPTITILGEQVAPTLLYSSNRANPTEVIDIKLSLDVGPSATLDNYIGFELYIEGEKTDSLTISSTLTTGEVGRYRYLWDGRDGQGRAKAPGVYAYQAKFSIPYRSQYCYALDGIFGNPPDCEFGATGVFVDAVSEVWVEGTIELDNQTDSVFGAGWVLDGQQRLYESEDNRILIADGQQDDEFLFAGKELLLEGSNVLAWAASSRVRLLSEELAVAAGQIIPTGDNPANIAFSADKARMYVVDAVEDTMSIIDVLTQQKIATIAVGNNPNEIAISSDEAFAYVTNFVDRTLSVVDLSLQQVVNTIPIGPEVSAVATSLDDAFVYVIDDENDNMRIIDTATQTVVKTVFLGNGPNSITLSPDGTKAYVANLNDDNIAVVDLVSQQRITTIPVGNRPYDIALSPDGDTAYVSNNWDNSISVVDLILQQEVRTFAVGSSPQRLAISADGATLYISDRSLYMYDTATGTRIDVLGLDGAWPELLLSADGTLLYATNRDADGISVINVDIQQTFDTVDVGGRAQGLAFASDANTLYVTNRTLDYVSVVDVGGGQVVTNIPVGDEPRDIILSPDETRAYVPNYRDSNMSILDLVNQTELKTMGMARFPQHIERSSNGRFAYITHVVDQLVSVVDLKNEVVTATIPLSERVWDIAIAPDDQFAYVTSFTKTMFILDLQTNVVVDTVAVGNDSRAVVVSPDGAYAFAASYDENSVYVVDLNTRQNVVIIPVANNPLGMAFSPDGGLLYVSTSPSVVTIDVATLQVVGTFHPTPSGVVNVATTDVSLLHPQSLTRIDYSELLYDAGSNSYRRVYPDGTEVYFNVDGTHDYTLKPDGRRTRYTYNGDGTLATMDIILPDGTTPHWQWQFNYEGGVLDHIIDPANRITEMTIDARGDLVALTLPDGSVQQFAYDARHLLTHDIDANGAVTSHSYDSYGRIRVITEPPRVVYDDVSGQSVVEQEVRTFTPSDTAYALLNDSPVGNPNTPAPPVPTSDTLVDGVAYGRGGRTGHTNAWGNWVDETDGIGRVTTYERDERNNITQINTPDGDCITYTYDDNGNTLRQTRQDAAGCGAQLGIQMSAPAQTMVNSYEPRFNQLKTHTDALGNTTTYTYDYEEGVGDAGKLIRITYPAVVDELGQTVTPTKSYTYNVWGLLETERDARGTVTQYVYTQGLADEAFDGVTPRFAPSVLPKPGLLTEVIQDLGGEQLVSIYRDFDAAGNPGTFIGPNGHEAASYTYDHLNRITSYTDGVGIVTLYEYDPRGNLVHVVVDYTADGVTGHNIDVQNSYNAYNQLVHMRAVAEGRVGQRTYTYDVNRQLASERDGEGNVTTYLYDDADQLVHVIDATGQVMTNTYTADGQLATMIDADGYVTRYIYDGLNRLVSKIEDEGSLNLTTQYSYDLNGNVLTVTDPVGTVTCYTYDSHDRRSSEVQDCGGLDLTLTYAYDVNGNLVYATDERGVVTYYMYDSLNRLTLTRLDDGGLNLENGFAYDAAGNLAQQMDERGVVTTYSYDMLNRLQQSCQDALGLNLCTTINYDRLDNPETVTAPDGIVTRTEYNAFLQPVRTVQDVGGREAVTQYVYDNVFNVIEVMDAQGRATQYEYTPRNELAQVRYADGTAVSYGYDGRGYQALVLNQDSDATTYTFDGAGRLQEIKLATEGNQQFYYDGASRLIGAEQTMAGHHSLLTYAYNPLGDVVSSTQRLDGGMGWSVNYDYGYVQGTMTTTYPSGEQRKQTTDSINRLQSVRRGDQSVIATYDYQDVSSYFTVAYDNGQTNRTDYDGLRRIIEVQSSDGGSLIGHYRYGYDAANNRTYMARLHEVGQPADVYEYNSLYQLTQVWYGADATDVSSITDYDRLQSYSLDKLGNRLRVTTDGADLSYLPHDGQQASNVMNRYEQVGSHIYNYDLRGNTLYDGVNGYSYNILEQQVGVQGAGGTTEYIYDAIGRRIAKVVSGTMTHYVYDKHYRVLEERADDGGLLAHYTYGSQADEPLLMVRGGTASYYHRDGLGSISEITDDRGALVEGYRYDVYGSPTMFDSMGVTLTTSTVDNPYLYVGRRYDSESGNYYYRARMYQPKIGRFLQMDPLGYADGMNRYAYVGNNPVTGTDPTGTTRIEGSWVSGPSLSDIDVNVTDHKTVIPIDPFTLQPGHIAILKVKGNASATISGTVECKEICDNGKVKRTWTISPSYPLSKSFSTGMKIFDAADPTHALPFKWKWGVKALAAIRDALQSGKPVEALKDIWTGVKFVVDNANIIGLAAKAFRPALAIVQNSATLLCKGQDITERVKRSIGNILNDLPFEDGMMA